MASEINEIRNFLKQKFINTSSEWVEACTQFIKQEYNQNISLQDLKNFVYQQWLNADLEEIGSPALPRQLAIVQKTTLSNSYALQVDGIRDVGRPAYAQHLELEKSANVNADFSSASETTIPSWEAKPSRMLMLNLTDGCTTVQGMEYKSINFLSPNLKPGLKVVVKGPVDCRLGIILLTPENIQVLGGEVESKLETYSRRTLLRQALQLPLDGNTDSPAEEDIDSAISIVQETTLQNNSTTNVASSNRQSAAIQSQINSTNDDLDNFGDDDDDFAVSLDYRALDELEKENSLRESQEFEALIENDSTPDIFQEDEEMLREAMAYQDEHSGFEMPFEEERKGEGASTSCTDSPKVSTASRISSLSENNTPNSTLSIKAFIVSVLSKLECTLDGGWSLSVKINDGTASMDVTMHDKVLEEIIGISASAMMEMQTHATRNPDLRKQAMQAISKCKSTLQNYNYMMDIQFILGQKPCIVKCNSIGELQKEQLLQRARASLS